MEGVGKVAGDRGGVWAGLVLWRWDFRSWESSVCDAQEILGDKSKAAVGSTPQPFMLLWRGRRNLNMAVIGIIVIRISNALASKNM